MLEGALIWDNQVEQTHKDSRWFIGENMYTVFNRLTQQLPDGELPEWLKHIEDVLEGKVATNVKEHALGENETRQTKTYRG